MKTYFGIKQTMTQTWTKSGKRLAVTVVSAAPLTVTQQKTVETDTYQALQVGFGIKPKRLLSKPLLNHLKKSKTHPRYLKELKLTDSSELSVGDSITPDMVFEVGDMVNVTGTTKGRGFSGVMKRWGFKGGPRTHGQSDRARAPGSIGQGTTPGRVYKQKKMAGHYGVETFTTKNLQIIKIDSSNHQIWLNGPIPGPTNGLIKLTLVRKKEFEGLYQDEVTSVNQSETQDSTQVVKKEAVVDDTQATSQPTPKEAEVEKKD